jgi:hypothetical protein
MDFNLIHASTEAVEELAEEFVFARVSSPDREEYEQHLLTCATCQTAVEAVLDFIRLLRDSTNPGGVES